MPSAVLSPDPASAADTPGADRQLHHWYAVAMLVRSAGSNLWSIIHVALDILESTEQEIRLLQRGEYD